MQKKIILNSRLSWQRWLVKQGYQISCCIESRQNSIITIRLFSITDVSNVPHCSLLLHIQLFFITDVFTMTTSLLSVTSWKILSMNAVTFPSVHSQWTMWHIWASLYQLRSNHQEVNIYFISIESGFFFCWLFSWLSFLKVAMVTSFDNSWKSSHKTVGFDVLK